jgi:hypothetical protein
MLLGERRLVKLAGLAVVACLVASCSKKDPKGKDSPTGLYKGRGASEEVRFRHPRGIYSLVVKHNTDFQFKIGDDGQVTGDGQITYELIPNTEGIDALAASVRGAMGVAGMAGGVPGVKTDGFEARNEHLDIAGKSADTAGKGGEIAGVGLSYTAPHLKNGPELRYFKLKGRLERTQLLDGQGEELRLVLEVDGDYKRHDGTADKDLVAAWAVNNKQEEVKFPCWSPFLKADGKLFAVLKRGEGGIWTADFSAKGTHRNNDKNWQEYGYYWLVQKRDF